MLSCNNPESGRWRGNVHPTVATVHSTATETPALHVEPGRLNATCVEHTTQMASFGARSIIRAATQLDCKPDNRYPWDKFLFQCHPATLRASALDPSPLGEA